MPEWQGGHARTTRKDVTKMDVEEALERLMELARKDKSLRAQLLGTKNSDKPTAEFCRIATENGCPMYVMDLISRGEDRYAAMRRSTNGGGENSPLLVGEDDDYELFLTELDRMNSEGI